MKQSDNRTIGQFNTILEENRRLSTHGLPHQLAPLASLFGHHAWHTLLILSFLLTLTLFIFLPTQSISFVKSVLFVK